MDPGLALCGIIMLLAVVGLPLYWLIATPPKKPLLPPESPTSPSSLSPSRASPPAPAAEIEPGKYLFWGSALCLASGWAMAVLAWGFLFPGLGLTEPNYFTTFRIMVPAGKGYGTRSYPLRPEDIDLTLFIFVIVGTLFLIGLKALYTVYRHHLRHSP